MSQLVVSVGTDHHEFTRLIQWVEQWSRQAPQWQIVVQHGRTRQAKVGRNIAFCDHEELSQLFATSDLVVTHGGPATITEARRSGHIPVVVPRDPALGEHVDNHQQLFTRRLGAAGMVQVVETYEQFAAALASTARLPKPRAASDAPIPTGVFEVGHIAERLVRQSRHRQPTF